MRVRRDRPIDAERQRRAHRGDHALDRRSVVRAVERWEPRARRSLGSSGGGGARGSVGSRGRDHRVRTRVDARCRRELRGAGAFRVRGRKVRERGALRSCGGVRLHRERDDAGRGACSVRLGERDERG